MPSRPPGLDPLRTLEALAGQLTAAGRVREAESVLHEVEALVIAVAALDVIAAGHKGAREIALEALQLSRFRAVA